MNLKKSKYLLIVSFAALGFVLLCFHSLRSQEGEITTINVVDAFNLQKSGLDKAPWLSQAIFSPDRIRLAIPFPDSIVIVNTTGEILSTIDIKSFGIKLLRFYDWSYEDKLLFHAEKPGDDGRGFHSPAAYIYDVSNRQLSLFRSPGLGGPRFSPDGKWIAFYKTDQEDYSYLWVVRSDGTDERMIASIGSADPVWAHNGEMIAYRKWESGEIGLWLYNFETDTHKEIHSPIGSSGGRFSPADSLLCFVASGRGLCLMNTGRKEMRELVPYPEENITISNFDWSPEGTRIALTLETASGDPLVIESSDIYLAELRDSGIRRMTHTPEIMKYRLHWLDEGTVVYIPKQVGRRK